MADIKISELSIGDWVQIGECGHHKGSIAKVWWLSRDSNHIGLFDTCVFSECEDDVLPIPLTPEILEKNGFVKEEDKDGNKRYSLIEGCTKFSLGYARSVFQWIFPIDVRYVHQLQHALRLAGVEKEIEV